ncbi:hypothetical protein HK405_012450 [Cladochytrium tenue]|nr:hypothetical protein HK405_012450 [Cladochytrium tenue]
MASATSPEPRLPALQPAGATAAAAAAIANPASAGSAAFHVRNWKTICHHNRRKTQCVLCFDLGIGGGSICPHRKRRDVCSACRRADPPTRPPKTSIASVRVLAKSPPSPSSDRDINSQLRSKSYSATPVLEPDSEVLSPDGKTTSACSPLAIDTSVTVPSDKLPHLPSHGHQHPYPAPTYTPHTQYEHGYEAYFEALDNVYYQHARAAAAHQHYMAVAAASMGHYPYPYLQQPHPYWPSATPPPHLASLYPAYTQTRQPHLNPAPSSAPPYYPQHHQSVGTPHASGSAAADTACKTAFPSTPVSRLSSSVFEETAVTVPATARPPMLSRPDATAVTPSQHSLYVSVFS